MDFKMNYARLFTASLHDTLAEKVGFSYLEEAFFSGSDERGSARIVHKDLAQDY